MATVEYVIVDGQAYGKGRIRMLLVKRDALRAENERLRLAIEEIDKRVTYLKGFCQLLVGERDEWRLIAVQLGRAVHRPDEATVAAGGE